MPRSSSSLMSRRAAKRAGLRWASALVALASPRLNPIGVRRPFGSGRSKLPATPYGQRGPNSGSGQSTSSNGDPPLSVNWLVSPNTDPSIVRRPVRRMSRANSSTLPPPPYALRRKPAVPNVKSPPPRR